MSSGSFGVFKVTAKTVIDIVTPKDLPKDQHDIENENTVVEDDESDKEENEEEEKEEEKGPRVGGLGEEMSIVRQMIALPLTSPQVFETVVEHLSCDCIYFLLSCFHSLILARSLSSTRSPPLWSSWLW